MKIGVWYAIGNHHIVGLIFHESTINSADYQRIFTDFIALLDATTDEHLARFQQDGAKIHTAAASLWSLIEEFFEVGWFLLIVGLRRAPIWVQQMIFYGALYILH